MKNIYLYPLEQKKQNSFVLLRKSSNYYEVGEDYEQRNGYGEKLLPVRCVHKQTLKLDELTSFHTYLLRDCSLKVFKEIMESQDFDRNQLFDFLMFSSYAYSNRTFFIGNEIDFRDNERHCNLIREELC